MVNITKEKLEIDNELKKKVEIKITMLKI